MIIDRTPLNLNEVEEIVTDSPESEKKEAMDAFLKKYMKMNQTGYSDSV